MRHPPKGVIPKGCTPWKKGQSGNPKGRPPLPSIKEIINKYGRLESPEEMKAMLRKKIPHLPNNISLFELMYLSTFVHGVKGQGWAVEHLAERKEGKVTQPVKFEDSTINITLNGKEITNGQDQH
jgi:hypothetical protein